MLTYSQAYEKLKAFNQSHVLRFFDRLSDEEKAGLLIQIEECDPSIIPPVKNKSDRQDLEIEPASVLHRDDIIPRADELGDVGLTALSRGEVAAVLLAGGDGSRLGKEIPKAMVDIGISREIFIIGLLLNELSRVAKKCGKDIPLFIMTSPSNNDTIHEFLRGKNFFGYPESAVTLFIQDMLPAIDLSGKYLMSAPGSLALAPNGNGGWLRSMIHAGLEDKLHQSGIKWINVFSVDNVLQKIADPLFIGAVISSGYDSGAKVIKKAHPEERVGVICRRGGRPSVIEYYEMPPELIDACDPGGNLLLGYGVTLNYLFAIEPLMRQAAAPATFHLAKKRIQTIDENGEPLMPECENGYKMETLALDALEFMNDCLPFEVIRDEEFAPIKNGRGYDSIDTARELLRRSGVSL